MLLTSREIETLIIALKYWRVHRDGGSRKSDRTLSREEVDLLLAKLGAGSLTAVGAEDRPPDLFHR
jgi:hypothetical protein